MFKFKHLVKRLASFEFTMLRTLTFFAFTSSSNGLNKQPGCQLRAPNVPHWCHGKCTSVSLSLAVCETIRCVYIKYFKHVCITMYLCHICVLYEFSASTFMYTHLAQNPPGFSEILRQHRVLHCDLGCVQHSTCEPSTGCQGGSTVIAVGEHPKF